MKAKKLLSLLLALIMCAGLVPAQVLAAGNKTIVINTDGVENGTVEIVSIPDDATQDGNKITGLTAKTGFVTVKATPKEGYEFINWTARFTMNNGSTWVPKTTPNVHYVLKSGNTFGSNPMEIAPGSIGSAKAYLELTPNFGIPLKLAVESSDPEMGEVVLGPNTGKQLTEKTEKGYVGSYTAGNVEIGYRLKDSEKYQFVGWTIRYTNGESGIVDDLDVYHYHDLGMSKTTTWPYDKEPWSTDETVVGNTVRDLIDYNRKGIKHDATITAVFNDKTSPNYALQDSYWNIRMHVIFQTQTIYYPTITGWDNTTNEVVVEFNDIPAADVLKSANECSIFMPIGKSGNTGKTAPGLVISFTDDAPKYTYKDENKLEYGFGQYTIDDFADAYEIHFNVLDNNGNTKPGVIRLNFKNRGKLTAEHGAVQYLGKQYENGSVIDFVPDGDGDATMTAVPEEGYKLLKWIINGTEYPANGNDITFAVPESTFDIQAVFAAPEFVVAGKTPRFDIRDNLLELTPFVTLATEGTVTGWSNDTDEQVVVTFNNVGTLPLYVAAYYRLNKDSYAPDGTSLSFDGRETGEKGSWLGWSRYYYTQLNADDYEIPFTITDKNGFVKRGVIRFERDGKAGIEAEHGSVIYNDTEYTNGQTIDVAAGEITLQAKADEGYAFAGWEIAGKEYSDNPLTIEADGKFFIIKAKFAKLVTVSTGEGIVSEGAARFADDETAESKTVAAGESVSITNVPGEKSKFARWHVDYEKAEGKFMPAEEGRHYTLGNDTSLSDDTITIVAKEYNLRVYPEFEPTYSITLQQAEGGKASFAWPVSAIGKDAVSGLTKDSNAVTWELESTETGYRFTKWGIEYFDTAKNEWVADPTLAGSFVTYRFWTPVNGDGRTQRSMSAKVTEYDLRITPQFSKGLTVEAVADPAAGGKVEASGDTDGYFYTNDMAFVTATANDGYEFNGWTVEYKQEDGTYAPAELAKHYSPFGSLDDADLGVRMKDYSLRFTAKFTKQLYVELAQGEHGTAEFVGVTPDADNRVYGPDDSTGNIVATVKATPEEGYAFGGWTILNADTGKKAVGLMGGQYGNYFLEDGESEASNPLRIGFSKHSSANFHVNLKLVPVFGKEMKVTVASDNSEYGTVTPEGENIVSSVGGKLDFGAKPAEDCLFMGWEITYADGTEIPEKEKDNLFSFNTNSTDNDATGDNNQLTIFSCEKDLKLTAHFVKKGEPNFVRYNSHKSDRGSMQAPRVTVFAPNMTLPSSYTGWSNDVSEPIVIIFDAPAMQSKSGLRLFYRYKSTDLTAAGVTFNLGEGTEHDASRDTTKYYVYNITAEEAATLYELPFTATDANGNVKKGVIRFAPARRALIEAENGAVSYNDATYAAGSIIDFPAGEATITAAANEGYAFAGWEIEGVELSEEQAKSETITFNVPEKFFTIKAKFEVAAKQLYVELAQGEHGTAEFVGVTPDANNRVYGPDDSTGNIVATVKATPEEGYVFGGWDVVDAETGDMMFPSEPDYNFHYEIADGGTVGSNPMGIGFSKSSFDGFHHSLKITPTFGKGIKVTVDSDNSAYGTVTPEGDNTVSGTNGVLDISAKPADGCLFMGWELTYADGTAIPDAEKVLMFMFTRDTADNDEVGGNKQLTVINCEKDLKLTAHFVKKGEPNFVRYNTDEYNDMGSMVVPEFAHNTARSTKADITGWSNDLSETIVVTLNTIPADTEAGVRVFYRLVYEDLTAAGVTFDFGEGTENDGSSASSRVFVYYPSEEQLVGLYELPFTATDANGNVKKGVIRFTPARRALIEAENGAVSYNDATYAAGSVIDFPAGEATITAAANEGYAFAGWEIEGVELSEEQAKSETLTFTVPEKFFTIKAKFEVDTTPGIKVTVKSENTAKGSAAATTDGLDNFKPNGTSIIELSATPAANCTLVGWTVTDTASGEYLDKSLYTLYEEGENKLLLAKGVDKDVTVTAYFANSTEGVFVMPGERLPAFTITGKDGTVYTGAIENWDNNTYNEIVVTFSGFGTSDILGQDMLITLSNGSSDVLAPTDLVMKRTDAGDGKEEVVRHEDGGKVYYSLSDYQRESRIPFTFTDRNGNVKKGTIKLNLDYRAEVYINGFCQPAGDRLGGYVLYNGNKYYSGDVIPFEPDAEGYVTITAVPEEKFANIEYVFKNWKMDTVELTADEVYANPLKFKPSREYCVIQPQFAGDGRLVVVTDAENGRAEFKKNGELVEGGEADGIAYGTDKLSVEAIPDDGYVFVRWQVEMNNSITDPDLWVGEKFTEDEQARLLARNTSLSESDIREAKLDFTLEGGIYALRLTPLFGLDAKGATITLWVGEKFTEDEQARLLARNTSLSESDIREAKLDFTLEGGIYALRLTPLFGLDAKGATITLDNSESEKGTLSSEDDLTDVRWYLPAVTIKAEKKDGYEFQGWTVTSTATGKRLYNGKDYEMVEVDEYTMTIRPLRTSTQDMTVKGIFPEYQPVHGTVKGHGYAVVYEGKEYREGDVITFPNGKGIATLEWKPDNANAHFVYWSFSDYVMNNESEARRQPRIDVQLLERDFEINVVMGYHVDYRIMCDGVDITRSDDWGNATGTNIYSLQGRESYDISKYPTIDDAIDNYSEIARNSNSINYAAPGDGVIFWFDENFRLGGNVINGRVKYVYDSITIEPAAEEIGIAKRLIDKQYGGYEDKSDEYRVWAAYVMPESDITIVINIRRVSYSQITAQPNNTAYGSVTISPEAASGDGYYKEGTYLCINAAAKSGYRFVKWEEAQGSSYLSEEQKLNSSLNLKVGADSAALTAVFEEDPEPVAQALNLVVDPAGKANVLVNGAKGVTGAFEGESVTVSLGDLDDYYEFDHWEITRDSSGESLITSAASYSESITFVMPNGSVTVKAVLNERAIGVNWRYWIKKGDNAYTGSSVTTPYMADISIWKNGVLQDLNSKITVVKGDTISFEVKLKDPNKYILEKIWLVSSNYMVKNYDDYKGEYTVTSWKHRGKKIYGLTIEVYFDTNNGDIQRYNLNVVQPASGGTIECSSVYPLADSVVKLTAKPEENYRLKRWIVTDEYNNAVDVTVDDSDANSAKFTMPAADVTVTAEFEQTDASGAEILAVDILSGKGGAVIASGTLAGDAWTVDLSGVIDKATADGIPQGTSGLYMRITANEGTTVEQVNAFTGDWSNGDIACYMPLNQGVIFIAHNGEQSRNYTITLAYSEPGAPELSNGSAERISDKEANIKFTSSEGGSCYYVVVESGAAEPAIDTEGRGMSISAGENTLMLTNLAKGARDIYIVVKNASGVASKPMKIEIPAFSSGEDDGEYTISVAEHVGGTLTPSRTRANEGDEVTISISAADGMQMKVGSLTYTEAIENGKTVTIENGKFTMPACDVTISCQWESTASQPTGGGITGFVIDGIPGTIDVGGNIVVTMPYKTDVTALRPVITGVNIAEMTPASGEAVDFTKPVIYTVTLTDGTVKLYTVTVQLQNAGAADELWDKLTDPSQTLPWWKYAEQQRNSGYYPRYW